MSKQFDIYPAKKGRRVLVFFADLFITLITSIFLFEIVVMQIARPIIDYNGIQTRMYNSEVSRRDLLVENGILFKSDSEYDFSSDLEKTAVNYIEFQIKNDEVTKNNDVLYTYFVNINKENVDKVNELLLNKCSTYFDKDKTTILGTYRLSETYINYFSPYFEEGNEMSEVGKTYFESFKEKEFLKLYQGILTDISTKDELKDSKNNTFNCYTNLINTEESYIKKVYVICSYISFFISIIVFYLVIPLTNEKGRTVSEMILKVERINVKKMAYLSKKYVLVEFLINTLENLCIIVFVPFITLGLLGMFALPFLYGGAMISVVFLIVQLIMLLANGYAKTLKEIATNSLCVDTSTMDDYYREISNI